MTSTRTGRREFLKASLGAGTAALAASPTTQRAAARTAAGTEGRKPRIRFAAIGLNHGHIYGQVTAVERGGGQLVSFYAKEPDLVAAFQERFPDARLARSEEEILEDSSIQLVVSASIPDERAPLGIRVMRAGKDFMVDKPGMTTLEQLAEVKRVQAETKRIYSILYSERHENRATVKADELVKAGAIGRVIQTVGLGPHRTRIASRPEWFFQKERYGGILTDIASHQFDQFLVFTGSTEAQVVCSQVGNFHHPQYPGLEDFGDAMVRGNGGTGYIRVDWFTPDGLDTWGDGRLTILGTDGYIEIRKNIDIAGRPGGNHLFLVDQKQTRYIDCSAVHLPYGERLVDDVLNRTETAMPQAHTFLAMELALTAEKNAARIAG
ncbi:MAG TPA: Gfo/Idh/MocA family oxidoreductase [Vicinamibacterales bacterium]|nr:Gfo/Idh/MocA family oxidoreductase [Vicinamibacterales bacterium]